MHQCGLEIIRDLKQLYRCVSVLETCWDVLTLGLSWSSKNTLKRSENLCFLNKVPKTIRNSWKGSRWNQFRIASNYTRIYQTNATSHLCVSQLRQTCFSICIDIMPFKVLFSYPILVSWAAKFNGKLQKNKFSISTELKQFYEKSRIF